MHSNQLANGALFEASRKGEVDEIDPALEGGADLEFKSGDYMQSPLNIASEKGQISAVRHLLNKGAKVNSTDRWDRTPLYYSAWKGQYEITRMLIDDHGANVEMANRDGMTPLMAAAMAGRTSTVKLLLDRGANVRKKDNEGKRALGWAKIKNQTDVVNILRARDMDQEMEVDT